ncbi:MAG: AAA family ATPase [Fimbriimonadaceae bacterium]
MAHRIHIVGASGSGTSTLGRSVAGRIRGKFLDTDDFYWLPTEPPFTQKRPIPERIQMIGQAVESVEEWVLSGSLVSWGGPIERWFTLVVFLELDAEIRLQRLRDRERERYGGRIEEGGDMYDAHLAFIEWAGRYDDPGATVRSRRMHEAWLATLSCTILRLDAAAPVEKLCDGVVAELP